jgi:hypothetical protein
MDLMADCEWLCIQYPLHLLNLASVRDFEAKIEKDEALRELDPRRFRANIIRKYCVYRRGCDGILPDLASRTLFYQVEPYLLLHHD